MSSLSDYILIQNIKVQKCFLRSFRFRRKKFPVFFLLPARKVKETTFSTVYFCVKLTLGITKIRFLHGPVDYLVPYIFISKNFNKKIAFLFIKERALIFFKSSNENEILKETEKIVKKNNDNVTYS